MWCTAAILGSPSTVFPGPPFASTLWQFSISGSLCLLLSWLTLSFWWSTFSSSVFRYSVCEANLLKSHTSEDVNTCILTPYLINSLNGYKFSVESNFLQNFEGIAFHFQCCCWEIQNIYDNWVCMFFSFYLEISRLFSLSWCGFILIYSVGDLVDHFVIWQLVSFCSRKFLHIRSLIIFSLPFSSGSF